MTEWHCGKPVYARFVFCLARCNHALHQYSTVYTAWRLRGVSRFEDVCFDGMVNRVHFQLLVLSYMS